MIKKIISTAFVLAGLFVVSTSLGADIESVRSRTLKDNADLTKADTQVVADYLADKFEEMVYAADFQQTIEHRAEIISNGGTCDATSYSAAYNAEIKKQIPVALENLKRSDDPAKKTLIRTSLLVITAELCGTDFIDFAVQMTADEAIIIRYWAVKTLVNQGVIDYLNTDIAVDKKTAAIIMTTLKNISASEQDSSILELLIPFADDMESEEADTILNNIADTRIGAYEDWTVTNELIDAKLLLAMGKKLKISKTSDMAEKFSQLFSHITQRYTLGADYLTEENIKTLSRVMVMVDTKALSELLISWRKPIALDIERRREKSLKIRFNTLFGTADIKGKLAKELDFKYKDENGKPSNAPRPLKSPESEQD